MELAAQATAGPRKRAHLLLHDGPADPVQRLMIVLQPNSYVRPHYHSRQWEMLVLQQGRGSLLIFDSSARLADRIELSPTAPVVQIPVGLWHGFVVLERNTAVLEVKPATAPTNLLIGHRRKVTPTLKDSLNGRQMRHLEQAGNIEQVAEPHTLRNNSVALGGEADMPRSPAPHQSEAGEPHGRIQ
jgi:cupin fold WbuC family metalloprotein